MYTSLRYTLRKYELKLWMWGTKNTTTYSRTSQLTLSQIKDKNLLEQTKKIFWSLEKLLVLHLSRLKK